MHGEMTAGLGASLSKCRVREDVAANHEMRSEARSVVGLEEIVQLGRSRSDTVIKRQLRPRSAPALCRVECGKKNPGSETHGPDAIGRDVQIVLDGTLVRE